jgi:ubiquinone/menaquinone biosynthesis C-methylase UbiE
MPLSSTIKNLYKAIRFPDKNSKTAYNIWSSTYDQQPGNLMLHLDEIIISEFLEQINLKDKSVVDIGCGTGRHWQKLYAKQPAQLIGYDVSEGMLDKLQQKYPRAITHLIKDDLFLDVEAASHDLLISTLTIAHIKNAGDAINAWCRLLKKKSEIIITDFHPETLRKGGKRSFVHEKKSFAVKNYIHSLAQIEELFGLNGFNCEHKKEIVIDESVKHYYEQQKALHIYKRFKGTAVIFGMYLKRTDDTE